MTMVKGLQNIVKNTSGFCFMKMTFLNYGLKKFSSFAKFKNKINVISIFKSFIEFDDVWMI